MTRYLRFPNPKQGIIPHELVHALVEKTLNVRGFIQMVFEGAVPEFAMKADGEAWLAEAMVEAVQGMLWSGHLSLDQFNDWVENICNQRKVEYRKIDEVCFKQLVEILLITGQKWAALKTGESFELSWENE